MVAEGPLRRSRALSATEAGEPGVVSSGDVSDASRRLSPEELRQLEERARARFADPAYRRRIDATESMARDLLGK